VAGDNKMSFTARLRAMTRAALGRQDAPERVKLAPTGVVYTGQNVTVDAAMQLSTVWACVRLISETVATLPLMLYATGANDARTVASNDPLYGLLHSAPNADNTAVEFWEGIVLSLCLWGNAYARKELLGGRLVALTPLQSDKMVVARNTSGALEYRYADAKGRAVYREDQIMHVRGFGGSADTGLSPIAFARQSIGAAMATDEMSGTMFANGARPSGILTVENGGVLTPEQRTQVRENIVNPFVGSANTGGVMVLEAGLKFQAVSMTPEDSQFLQTRAFQVEEICRWFRVPPFMVGHTEKSTSWGTGLEQQLIGFLTFALRPYLTRIEQAISRSLILPEQRDRLKPEFKVEGLLRSDSTARAAYYKAALGTTQEPGWMVQNEIRRLENLEPLPGGDVPTPLITSPTSA